MITQTISHIDFLLETTIKNISFNPAREEGLSFVSSDGSLSLYIRPADPASDPFGHRRGLQCKATISVEATDTETDFVKSLISRHYVVLPDSPISLPYVERGIEQISSEGNLRKGYGLRYKQLPTRIANLLEAASRELKYSVSRFIRLLRWSQEIDSDHHTINHAAIYWRADPGDYYGTPLYSGAQSMRGPRGVTWEEKDRDLVQLLWAAEADEPLGHELLREATALIRTSPRSALLVLSTALEAGVKHHIGRTVIGTEWLMNELPSPPVYKLLSKYLPTIHTNSGSPSINWKTLGPLFKLCQKLMEDRNKLTHTGHMPEGVEVYKYMVAVRDVMYILDYLEGHGWARSHVSHQTRISQNWTKSGRSDIFIRVAEH